VVSTGSTTGTRVMCDHLSMPTTADRPVAVRATAFVGESRWLRRPVRRVWYDAVWADGRVDFDVSLASAMYRGSPADFASISDVVHDCCPEAGPGRWVNDFGQVIDGPAELNPNPPGSRSGRPSPFGIVRREPNPRVRLAWRLGLGVLGLTLAVLLLTGPSTDGPVGPVGVLCCIGGVAGLASLVPRKLRGW